MGGVEWDGNKDGSRLDTGAHHDLCKTTFQGQRRRGLLPEPPAWGTAWKAAVACGTASAAGEHLALATCSWSPCGKGYLRHFAHLVVADSRLKMVARFQNISRKQSASKKQVTSWWLWPRPYLPTHFSVWEKEEGVGRD